MHRGLSSVASVSLTTMFQARLQKIPYVYIQNRPLGWFCGFSSPLGVTARYQLGEAWNAFGLHVMS